MAVALEEVYDAFGFGEVSPEAIHDFLSFAYHHWTAPSPRYVLLLGEATSDPKEFIAGRPRKDLLPTALARTSYLWTASDPALASVNGEDLLPDLAIGRLTANSLDEAQAAVQKILDFEHAGLTLDGKAVLVADKPDPAAGDFEANVNDIASLLSGRPTQKLFRTSSSPTPRPPSSTPSIPLPRSSPTSATATRATGPPSSPSPTSPASAPRPSCPSSSP